MSQSLTDEQMALIETNRKRALEKRKLAETRQTQTAAATGQSKQREKLPATKMSSNYYEYNLATMRDTKGGFLEEEPKHDSPQKKRRVIDINDIPYDPDPEECPMCTECGSLDLDMIYLKVFKVYVCKSCTETVPDKYSLLTKTEAKDDYLLTDDELRDRALFPVWEKPNPHKSTWNNMLLYLRQHLESFAIEKWGSLENLDKEFERRVDEKRARKEKKYNRSVAELRRRTRVEEWEKKRREKLKLQAEHVHQFENLASTNSDDEATEQKCVVCGIVVEVEELF
ncbi:DNA repair protein rad14 [Coemansia sp. IMI 203386]|nr:DNA repair protein rad14 [Coemansia sp. IMI 203386]